MVRNDYLFLPPKDVHFFFFFLTQIVAFAVNKKYKPSKKSVFSFLFSDPFPGCLAVTLAPELHWQSLEGKSIQSLSLFFFFF